MECEQALALLSAYIDGEIEAGDRAILSRTSKSARTAGPRGRRCGFRMPILGGPSRRGGGLSLSSERRDCRPASKRPRGKTSKFMAYGAVSAAVGFLLALLLFRPWQKPAEPVIHDAPGMAAAAIDEPPPILLTVAQGTIEVLGPSGGNGWSLLRAGEPVSFSARVRTGPESRCEFRLADGSEIRLNSATQMLFVSDRQFTLSAGQILARVADAPVPFRVAIPGATVTAIGTEFDILCRPVEAVLTVLEGAAEVTGKGGKQFVLTGEAATIIAGRIARKEAVRNLVQATSWTHEILKLKGPNNRELEKRVADILAQIGQSKTEFLTDEMIRDLGFHCALPLTRFIESERSFANVNQRHQAARLLSELAQPWSIPDLIKLLADKDGVVRYYASLGLKRLTGETFGRPPEAWKEQPWERLESTYKQWKMWWHENRQRYPSGP